MADANNDILIDSVEWESICDHCGRCCYEKYDYRGKIFYTKIPCQYLNTETNLCRIYDRRSELNPNCACLTPKLVRAGILPDDCPYVKKIKADDIGG